MIGFFSKKVSKYIYWFFKAQCYYTLNCTVVIFTCTGKPKTVTHFIIVFALLWWSGLELTVSLGHASKYKNYFSHLFKVKPQLEMVYHTQHWLVEHCRLQVPQFLSLLAVVLCSHFWRSKHFRI